ncbi:hypothetical protein VM1G_04434 [Cytospora mali]|uniref:Uncharacterized protein n=1 Tax=Cytospora mali TaxID=578113 RepID=A0A194VVL3_CYTMA|nr:hypothetical protein VM1G_04434 [Valsa mali]
MDPNKPLSDEEANIDTALKRSVSTFEAELLKQNLVAKQSHNVDLFKTQLPIQGFKDGDVLVLVQFPGYSATRSCTNTNFRTACIRLTLQQVLNTGSELLKEYLADESYQHRAKKAAEPLPKGITYVLDLSPSTGETEYTISLQRLSITSGIKLWYRSTAIGVSVATVAGHDDSCDCHEQWNIPYPMNEPPEFIQGPKAINNFQVAAYLFDTDLWAIDNYRNIDEFCQVRQGANTVRLFRSLSDNDLHIDSAPRLWTLVGLFSMFKMTNYDLLRDHVTAWFNEGNNFVFVEMLPEETIRIGTVLDIPAISEPAFRILVNERALVIAGGDPRKSNRTIFGRKPSDCLTGTDDTEKIMQKIEHAGVIMAERYKNAIDNLCSSNALLLLGVPEWKKILDLGKVIPDDKALGVSYNALVSAIQLQFREAVEQVINMPPADLPTDVNIQGMNEDIDIALSYSVSKNELFSGKSFEPVYATLNRAQKALCPLLWLGLRKMSMGYFIDLQDVQRAALKFSMDLRAAKKKGQLLPGSYPAGFDTYDADFFADLFDHAIDQLKIYVEPLISRTNLDFNYLITPHMVLCLNEQEMGYFRFEDGMAHENNIPETDLGPSGPGPAFHTGTTVLSASDSVTDDLENLTINSDGGASTVVGSKVAQDGYSTVYDRRQVLSQSESIASEHFTDDAMSAEYAEAGAAVSAAPAAPASSTGNEMRIQQGPLLAQFNYEADDIYGVSDFEDDLEFEDDDEDDDINDDKIDDNNVNDDNANKGDNVDEDDGDSFLEGDTISEDDDISVISHNDAELSG